MKVVAYYEKEAAESLVGTDRDADCYEDVLPEAQGLADADDNHNTFRRAALFTVLVSAALASLFGMIWAFLPKSFAASAKPASTPSPVRTAAPVLPAASDNETEKKRCILLDAGHGGFDPGTEGIATGVFESDINLSITKKIQSKLEAKGYLVLMTRTDKNAIAAGKKDDMSARVAIISRSNADVFVSIHQNALDVSSVCGCEVYYHETMPKSKQLAECVEKHLSTIEDAAPSRGVKTYDHMLTSHLKYSILIECGFLTNPEEEARLTSDAYQEKLADAVVAGIEEFFANYFEE